VFINYGQVYAANEEKAVRYVVDYLKGYDGLHKLKVINTEMELKLNIPGVVSDYIPIRNLVLASLTANYAISIGCKTIAVGSKTAEVRPDDPWSFADCSIEFFKKFSDLVTFATEDKEPFWTIMPLIVGGKPLTKTEVIKVILDSGMDINKLWSCYTDNDVPCWECYHCLENIKSFEELGYDYRGNLC